MWTIIVGFIVIPALVGPILVFSSGDALPKEEVEQFGWFVALLRFYTGCALLLSVVFGIPTLLVCAITYGLRHSRLDEFPSTWDWVAGVILGLVLEYGIGHYTNWFSGRKPKVREHDGP